MFQVDWIAAPPTGLVVDGSYLGTKVASVDASHRIDGGCVATSADGRSWSCYLGASAVAHGIVDTSVLGTTRETPAHG